MQLQIIPHLFMTISQLQNDIFIMSTFDASINTTFTVVLKLQSKVYVLQRIV